MEKTCVFCSEKFEAERSTAKYCSDKCKKLAFFSVPKEGAVLEVSVPEEALSVPKPVSVPVTVLDVVKDLKLSFEKDLGVYGMTNDGIFIRDDITEQQVRNIRSLVAAKHGWPQRDYSFSGVKMNTNPIMWQRPA